MVYAMPCHITERSSLMTCCCGVNPTICHAPGYQNVQEAPSEIHAEHGLIKAHGMQAIVGDVHVEATALPKRHVMRRLKYGVEAWRTQKNRMVGDATLLAAELQLNKLTSAHEKIQLIQR